MIEIIEDLEDIIQILIDMLTNNNISVEEITLTLRKYHYCFNCRHHFRQCKCGETESSHDEYNDDYISSSCSINEDDSEFSE